MTGDNILDFSTLNMLIATFAYFFNRVSISLFIYVRSHLAFSLTNDTISVVIMKLCNWMVYIPPTRLSLHHIPHCYSLYGLLYEVLHNNVTHVSHANSSEKWFAFWQVVGKEWENVLLLPLIVYSGFCRQRTE